MLCGVEAALTGEQMGEDEQDEAASILRSLASFACCHNLDSLATLVEEEDLSRLAASIFSSQSLLCDVGAILEGEAP